MLEMPSNPNTAITNPTDNPSSLYQTDHIPKINTRPKLLSPRVVNASSARAKLIQIDKLIRVHVTRINELAAEMRAAVDGLVSGVVITPPPSSTIVRLIECVAAHTGISQRSILSDSRFADVCRARQICFYLAAKLSSRPLTSIGAHFSRDYTTVAHGAQKIRRLMLTDEKLRNDIEAITATIEGRA